MAEGGEARNEGTPTAEMVGPDHPDSSKAPDGSSSESVAATANAPGLDDSADAGVAPESCPVTVAVHVRPLLHEERRKSGCDTAFTVTTQDKSVSKDSKDGAAGGAERARSGPPDLLNVDDGRYIFEYDYIYSDESINGRKPEAMYEDCVEPLVEGLFGGYSATVLAYGQTGSGKTYTMGGLDFPFSSSPNSAAPTGIIPRAVTTLYQRLDQMDQSKIKVKVSYVEIYNEEIRDLLASASRTATGADAATAIASGAEGPGSHIAHDDCANPLQRKGSLNDKHQQIQIRESADGSVHLVRCSEVLVKSKSEMTELFQKGVKLRSTSRTGMNKQSSRSHAIFTVSVETETAKSPAESSAGAGVEVLRGKMNLVDLAGSERVKRTQAEGATFKEGVSINKGLLALGNVISALASDASALIAGENAASGNDTDAADAVTHVPYRDSKLTRILRDALGGNSKTVMIACVSPCTVDCDESVNTLRYAQRARSITNVVTKEALDALNNGSARALREALDRSKAENAALRKQLCLCRSEVATLKSIIKFGTHGAARHLPTALAPAESLRPGIPPTRGAAGKETLIRADGDPLPLAVGGDAEEALSLKTLERHVSKLDAALEEKERAMEQVMKGVNQMHQQIVKTCASPTSSSHCAESAKEGGEGKRSQGMDPDNGGSPTSSREGEEDPAKAPDTEMKQLVLSMESEIGALQVQKLDLLQQLQEYASTTDHQAALQDQSNHQGAPGRPKSSRQNQRKNGTKKTSQKQFRQRQMLLDKVKRLESVLSELKKKHAKLVNLERLKKKSDTLCERLKKDVEEIKRQKCHLMKEISAKAKKFQTFQKTTKKEMQSLQREKAKSEQAKVRLEINREKQTQALKRKTEECAKHKTKLRQLARKDSGSAGTMAASASDAKKHQNDVPDLQPNALAPLLRDEKSRQIWIEEEIEACTLLEKLRDGLKETHSDTVECSQCIKTLKNKSRVLERKIDKSKRASNAATSSSSSSSSEGTLGNPRTNQTPPQLGAWEKELSDLRAQLLCAETSRKSLDKRMEILEDDLSALMQAKAASFMLTHTSGTKMDDNMARDGLLGDPACSKNPNPSARKEAKRFAKLLISGKHGMNANGMSSDLRRWSGLRSLAEARGMLRIVFAKAIQSRIDAVQCRKALEDKAEEGEPAIFEDPPQASGARGAPVDAEDASVDAGHKNVEDRDVDEGEDQDQVSFLREVEVTGGETRKRDKKKHSYVDQRWVDDILKEQADILKELQVEEKSAAPKLEPLKPVTANAVYPKPAAAATSASLLARKALEKYGTTAPVAGVGDVSPNRLKLKSKPIGWAETKRVIDDVLKARGQ